MRFRYISFSSFLVSILIVACTTYDTAIVYHKNFISGTNSLLRFDGYYSDSTSLNTSSTVGNESELDYGVKPVFLYANGSAFSTNNSLKNNLVESQVKNNQLIGSWGNYLIAGDSIQLEKFQLIENNYVRIILHGTISKNQIHWTSRKYHRENFKPVDYTIYFHSLSVKPDSSANFTRTLNIYNKK